MCGLGAAVVLGCYLLAYSEYPAASCTSVTPIDLVQISPHGGLCRISTPSQPPMPFSCPQLKYIVQKGLLLLTKRPEGTG